MTIQICTRDSKKIPLPLLSPHFFKVHYSKQLLLIFLYVLSKCFKQINIYEAGGTLYFVLVFNLTIILKYLFYFDISFPIFYSYNKLLKNEDIILGEGRCA